MSEDAPTQSGDLGPMPEPEIEPGEPNPGGVDALPEDEENVPADLAPEDNPAVEVKAPDPDIEEAADGDVAEGAPAVSDEADEEADAPDEDPTDDQAEVEGPPGDEGAGEPSA